MNLLTLWENYVTRGNQFSYYVSVRNAPQADNYERQEHAAAVALVRALIDEHGITASELTESKEWAGNDAT